MVQVISMLDFLTRRRNGAQRNHSVNFSTFLLNKIQIKTCIQDKDQMHETQEISDQLLS